MQIKQDNQQITLTKQEEGMLQKKSKAVIFAATLGLVVGMSSLAVAGYGKKAAEAPVEAAAPAAEAQAPAAGAMSEEMMAKMQEYSTPNENHKALQPLVGSWDYSLKMWMDPQGPAEESTGTAETKWIMDGRFVEQTTQGMSKGQPFTGQLVSGYDNAEKEYVSTWFDNIGTGMMIAKGTYDPATKTFTEKGDFTCPIKGKMSFRWETKIIDDNNYVLEGYGTDASGQEVKSMEIVYKRKTVNADVVQQ